MGKLKIYFGTNSNTIPKKLPPSISTVLFKITKDDSVTYEAIFIDILYTNPPSAERLEGEASKEYAVYYSFNQLTPLATPVPLSSLRYYSTPKSVSRFQSGCCFVKS